MNMIEVLHPATELLPQAQELVILNPRFTFLSNLPSRDFKLRVLGISIREFLCSMYLRYNANRIPYHQIWGLFPERLS